MPCSADNPKRQRQRRFRTYREVYTLRVAEGLKSEGRQTIRY
jgi:hypothetical protein